MKVSNTFNSAIGQAAELLAKHPTDIIKLETPFSGMSVQMTESQDFPSEKKRFKDYAIESDQEYFFLVIFNFLGGK